jgi:hypothetical protein
MESGEKLGQLHHHICSTLEANFSAFNAYCHCETQCGRFFRSGSKQSPHAIGDDEEDCHVKSGENIPILLAMTIL